MMRQLQLQPTHLLYGYMAAGTGSKTISLLEYVEVLEVGMKKWGTV